MAAGVPDLSLIDTAAFSDLQAAAGAEFVAELVQTFAEEAPRMVDELRTALAAGTAEPFRRTAHSLKSNSQTFGARHLAEQARALEHAGLGAGSTATPASLDALSAELQRTLRALQALARG